MISIALSRSLVACTLVSLGMPAQQADRGAAGEPTPIVLGESLKMRSDVLDEVRPLRVYLPPSYAGTDRSYPVTYVLDGGANFLPTLSTVQMLATGTGDAIMPETIVVAVHNTDRERDLRTPTLDGDHGGRRFTEFLAAELLPFIEERYRTNALRILIGHSQGGSFATYVLATRPETFRFYLTIDPPLHLTPGLQERVIEVLSREGSLQRLVSCEIGLGWHQSFEELARSHSPQAYVDRIGISDATHTTMFIPSIFAGLQSLFHDYRLPENDVTPEAVLAHYENLSRSFGYEILPPRSALSDAAFSQVLQGRGRAALELYARMDELYGGTPGGNEAMMREQARALAEEGPDRDWSELYRMLELPPPGVEEMAPYLGVWEGEVDVPHGTSYTLRISFVVEDGVVVTRTRASFPGGAAIEGRPEFVTIDGDQLRWGRPDRSAGITVATVRLEDGELRGKTELLGVVIPPHFGVDLPVNGLRLKRR